MRKYGKHSIRIFSTYKIIGPFLVIHKIYESSYIMLNSSSLYSSSSIHLPRHFNSKEDKVGSTILWLHPPAYAPRPGLHVPPHGQPSLPQIPRPTRPALVYAPRPGLRTLPRPTRPAPAYALNPCRRAPLAYTPPPLAYASHFNTPAHYNK